MKKKNIKALFSSIRKHENETVFKLLSEIPELVNICASAPPKKDDGQSPLQVAFKTGNFKIADHLIDVGADVNFIEESEINEWRAPVLHDALRAVAFSARGKDIGDFESFTAAIGLVEKLLRKGADPNSVDSYGNNCLLRALLDTRQRISSDPGFPEKIENDTLREDLKQIFITLINAGADIHAENENRESALNFVTEPALAQLLK